MPFLYSFINVLILIYKIPLSQLSQPLNISLFHQQQLETTHTSMLNIFHWMNHSVVFRHGFLRSYILTCVLCVSPTILFFTFPFPAHALGNIFFTLCYLSMIQKAGTFWFHNAIFCHFYEIKQLNQRSCSPSHIIVWRTCCSKLFILKLMINFSMKSLTLWSLFPLA